MHGDLTLEDVLARGLKEAFSRRCLAVRSRPIHPERNVTTLQWGRRLSTTEIAALATPMGTVVYDWICERYVLTIMGVCQLWSRELKKTLPAGNQWSIVMRGR
jgi:hypothetical protein